MNSTIERMNRNQFPIYRLHLQVSKCVLFIQEIEISNGKKLSISESNTPFKYRAVF